MTTEPAYTSECAQLVAEQLDRLGDSYYTFTEDEALEPVWRAGYEVTASGDPRFVPFQEGDRERPPQWRLASQTIANNRLLDSLLTGTWDGRDVEAELDRVRLEDGVLYVFCPTDSRFRRRLDGSWEPSEEKELPLDDATKAELDGLAGGLLKTWMEGGSKPWTTRHVFDVLEELGWQRAEEPSSWLLVRSWLRQFPSIMRVGPDFWIPADSLPSIPDRRPLRVLPVSGSSAGEGPSSRNLVHGAPALDGHLESSIGPMTLGASIEVTKPTRWTVTLRTVNLIEGYIHVPATARSAYPALAPGSGDVGVVKGKWFDSGDDLWLWLDRVHDRLYGPDLADHLAWCEAGERLQVDWNADVVVLRSAGVDAETREEESRLVDAEALRELRAGVGETYRQSAQAILAAAPTGLTFRELVEALRARQLHPVHRETIRALLYAGGFAHREGRWFLAADEREGARRLRRAIAASYVDDGEPGNDSSSILRAVRTRLEEIVAQLRSRNHAG